MEDLKSLLARHEGVRRLAYDDATEKPVGPGMTVRGKITIGVGRNLVDAGLSADEISHLLRNDIERCSRELDKVLSWANALRSTPAGADQYVLQSGRLGPPGIQADAPRLRAG